MIRRDVWLTSLLGLALLIGIPVVAITGLLSNVAYDPRVGENVLAQGRALGPFDFYLFHWPTNPPWLYGATQGIHVAFGLALVPIVLAKIWSGLKALAAAPLNRAQFAWALERASLVFLAGGMIFEFVTGLFEIEYYEPFSGVQLIAVHYYAGWIVIIAFALHATAKLPTLRRALRTRRALAFHVAGQSEPADGDVVATRRLLLGTTAMSSLFLLIQGGAPSIGGPVRKLGFLLPRGNDTGTAPNDFIVNGTAASAGLTAEQLGPAWRMRLTAGNGSRERRLSREQLLSMPQHTHSLPIACREGWTTTQTWTGVRLRDLAALVGAEGSLQLTLDSLDGATASFAGNQVSDDRSLLALHVNGVPISHDHGYPARVVVPGAVGVNCLKWISAMEFTSA